MKKILSLITLLLIVSSTFSQNNYDPKILVLNPLNTEIDPKLNKELKKLEEQIELNKKQELENSEGEEDIEDESPNIQLMKESRKNYLKNINFFKYTTYVASEYLTYVFFERFKESLINPKDTVCNGELIDYASIAKKEEMQFIVNFTRIHLYKKGSKKFADITIQVYDNVSQNIILENTYTGDYLNPGFEFACEEKSISCCINNALSIGLKDVIHSIARKNTTIAKKKEQANERAEILKRLFINHVPNSTLVKEIIPSNDSTINVNSLYATLTNNQKDKCMAFFLEKGDKKELMEEKNKNGDRQINIQMKEGMSFEDAFSNNVYGYIIVAIKENGKWYYEKKSATYFNEDNYEVAKNYFTQNQLINSYFLENSIETNPLFFETNFFRRIESSVVQNKDKITKYQHVIEKTKDEKKKEMYQNWINEFYEEDIKNKPYIGMYEIIADQLKSEQEAKNEAFSKNFQSTDLFRKTVENLCATHSLIEDEYAKTKSEYHLLYPESKNVILSPITLKSKSGQEKIFYIIYLQTTKDRYKAYLWNYFPQVELKKEEYANSYVQKQISTLTKWDYSFETLEDELFWNQYVLLKENNNYKYLIEL